MMEAKNRRDKGKKGEREFKKLLIDKHNLVPRMNYEQTVYGGADIVVKFFGIRKRLIIEVKRVETIYQKLLDEWWNKLSLDPKGVPLDPKGVPLDPKGVPLVSKSSDILFLLF